MSGSGAVRQQMDVAALPAATRMTHFGHWRKKFAVMHNAAFL
jgi:hypothetical protein